MSALSVVLEYAALGFIAGRVRALDARGLHLEALPVRVPAGAELRVTLVSQGSVVARVRAQCYPLGDGLRLRVAATDLPAWRLAIRPSRSGMRLYGHAALCPSYGRDGGVNET